MDFDWDDSKAEANLRKHGVSFLEAASVFDDELSITFRDPDHSAGEERFIIIGHSHRGRLLFVSHTDRGDPPVSSVRGKSHAAKERSMKMSDKNAGADAQDELRPEYGEAELSELLANGIRGKYVERYRQGTNLVKLAPDVAAAFPTEQSVNDALRSLLENGKVAA